MKNYSVSSVIYSNCNNTVNFYKDMDITIAKQIGLAIYISFTYF